MSDTKKQQNFLQGTAMLAMATAIVKVIGALYKIPLNAIIALVVIVIAGIILSRTHWGRKIYSLFFAVSTKGGYPWQTSPSPSPTSHGH